MNEFNLNNGSNSAKPSKAIIYCRLASVQQAGESSALALQEARCRELASSRGYEIVETVHDIGESGNTTARPGIEKILGILEKQQDAGQYVVVVDDISRLARNMDVYLNLREAIVATGAQLDHPEQEREPEAVNLFVERLKMARAARGRRREL